MTYEVRSDLQRHPRLSHQRYGRPAGSFDLTMDGVGSVRFMSPPKMAGWNLALRFGLEIAALVGIAAGAWELADGPLRWVTVVGMPAAAAAVWGVFNVPEDPSRSGEAPVEVPGWGRLLVELAVLGGGAVGFAVAGWAVVAVGYAILTVVHYLVSWRRIEWLISA
jgi:hypothetical protein